jgi:hypothetical protein
MSSSASSTSSSSLSSTTSTNSRRSQLYDFKSPKISTFELSSGATYCAAFTLHKKHFGTVRQCKLMHQLLYHVLYEIGIRNLDVVTSRHEKLTNSELNELPQFGGMTSQAWLHWKATWRLKILKGRTEKYLAQQQDNSSSEYGTNTTNGDALENSKQVDDEFTFLEQLWGEIANKTLPLCSKTDLELIEARKTKTGGSKRKRKQPGNVSKTASSHDHESRYYHNGSVVGMKGSSSSSSSGGGSGGSVLHKKAKLGRSNKTTEVKSMSKKRKIYRPKGVTVITAEDLNVDPLSVIGRKMVTDNNTEYVLYFYSFFAFCTFLYPNKSMND